MPLKNVHIKIDGEFWKKARLVAINYDVELQGLTTW